MDVRDNILKHTTRLLAAHGFGATSLQAIADAVGIRKASILYHFPSKNALRKAALDGLLYRWNEVLPSLLLGAGSSA
ncbi:MAG: TetR/AcrR family transcriptional regulator, partial [Myxococcota bacterium]